MKVQANLNSRTSIIPYSNQVMFDLSKIHINTEPKTLYANSQIEIFFQENLNVLTHTGTWNIIRLIGMDSRFALIHKKAQEQKLLKN